MNPDDAILREADVRRRTGLCRTSRYQLERAGLFPRRRRLTNRAVGWLASEVNDWIARREEVPTCLRHNNQ